MKLEYKKLESKKTCGYEQDIENNIEFAEKFINNFNKVYEKENQLFFIKICEGHWGKKYVAFIFHPPNTYPCGNCVCPVYADQPYDLFLKDFKAGYFTILEMVKQFKLKLEKI